MSCVALTSLTARPRALRAGRGSTSRGRVQVAPVRAAASSAVPALATKTNPLENINLLDVAGNPAQPWNTDKTVVVSFLRHFG